MIYKLTMLIKFRYLDKKTLLDYIALIEDGVRQSGSSKSMTSRGLGGELAFGAAKAQANRKGDEETTLTLEDHDSARLGRLIEAGYKDPEKLGWIKVNNPDDDFEGIGRGAIIEWECDIYIPEVISVLSRGDEIRDLGDMVTTIAPVAQAFNLDISGFPDTEQLLAMSNFGNFVDTHKHKVEPVIVGEDDDTRWRVVGTLDRKWIDSGSSLEDRVCIIGKVTKIISEDKWYPLMSLPGMKIVSRKERREMARRGPESNKEESLYLKGPLLVLDYLAIYS